MVWYVYTSALAPFEALRVKLAPPLDPTQQILAALSDSEGGRYGYQRVPLCKSEHSGESTFESASLERSWEVRDILSLFTAGGEGVGQGGGVRVGDNAPRPQGWSGGARGRDATADSC